jgi:hypothetical protein
METATTALDCGHEPTEDGRTFTTGRATLPDGRHVCYDCADAWQREELRTVRSFTAYLTDEGRTISTWSGGTLGRVVQSGTGSAGYCGTATYVQVVDCHGQRWHGRGPGVGMYIRLRRSVTT